ncbi:MAG: hypothetical protein AAB497_03360 [Patescibacteria group bacterium]
MTKRNFIIFATLVLFFIASVAYYFYRPDWQIKKVVRGGEMNGKSIQTVVADRSFRDFEFSPVMNGMTAYIADLPADTVITSLHASLGEVFEGEDGAMPSLQMMIQNDNGTACTMDVNNIVDDIQTLAQGKICAIGEKSTLMIRDASAMHGFKNGSIKVLLSFVTL